MSFVWLIEDAYLDFISLKSTVVDFRIGGEKGRKPQLLRLYGACDGIMEMNVIKRGKERRNYNKS